MLLNKVFQICVGPEDWSSAVIVLLYNGKRERGLNVRITEALAC